MASAASPVHAPPHPTPATDLLPVQAADEEAATVGLARVAPVFAREEPPSSPDGFDYDGFDPEPPPRLPITGSKRRSRRRLWLIVPGVVGVLAALYLVDLLTGMGSIPRATTVAGVEVGGMSYPAAEEKLHAELDPRQAGPVAVQAAEVTTTINPTAAGLSVDWPATLERAKVQPYNPITRLLAFFTAREVGVATVSDGEKLTGALQALQPVVDRPVAEGNVRFEGLRPIPVDPVPGRALDVPAASGLLLAEWINGATVQLPMNELPPITTPEAVRAAIAQVATPAVSAPVTLVGEGKQATITPETIAAALTFVPDGPNLKPQLQSTVVADAVRPGARVHRAAGPRTPRS